MILPISEEIDVLGVANRGTPNKERILAKARVSLELQEFLLLAGILQPDKTVSIIRNILFAFDQLTVPAGSWIVIYTGPGKSEVSRLATTLEPAYVFHWGFSEVLFTRPDIVPVFFRVNAIDYEGGPFAYSLGEAEEKMRQAKQLKDAAR
jgi:hypothetical protein